MGALIMKGRVALAALCLLPSLARADNELSVCNPSASRTIQVATVIHEVRTRGEGWVDVAPGRCEGPTGAVDEGERLFPTRVDPVAYERKYCANPKGRFFWRLAPFADPSGVCSTGQGMFPFAELGAFGRGMAVRADPDSLLAF